jgi:CRP-like cAMP-binding protein
MSAHPNGFLRNLSKSDHDALSRLATVHSFPQGEVIAEIGTPIDRVFFVNSGMISLVVPLQDGGAIEAGVVGRNEVFGGCAALGLKCHVNTAVVQMEASASVIKASDLAKAADASPSLRLAFVLQEQFLLAQAQQSAACNGVHHIRQRLATWLLRVSDRAQQEDLQLTQEFLSQMLGVQRASVSLAASELRDEGMITYRRGHVRITDRERLEQTACECNSAVRKQFDRTIQFS